MSHGGKWLSKLEVLLFQRYHDCHIEYIVNLHAHLWAYHKVRVALKQTGSNIKTFPILYHYLVHHVNGCDSVRSSSVQRESVNLVLRWIVLQTILADSIFLCAYSACYVSQNK